MSAMRQSSDSPTTKTWSVVIAGALTTVIAWAMRQWGHIDVPAEIALALQTIIAFAAAYLTPPGAADTVREVVPGPLAPDPPRKPEG